VAGSSVLELLTMTCSDSDSDYGRRVARVRGATVTGLTATLIDVQATIDPAKQGFEIPGAPGYQTWPLRDRVRAAVLNSAMAWPYGDITVELGPGTRFQHGCGLDLAIAVAVLAASGAVPSPAVADRVFVAELGLDGQLRPVRSIVPALVTASEHSEPVTVVIAVGNQPDAATVPGLHVAACAGLGQVAGWLSGEQGADEHFYPRSLARS
jgi:magnesium chelatase family protein